MQNWTIRITQPRGAQVTETLHLDDTTEAEAMQEFAKERGAQERLGGNRVLELFCGAALRYRTVVGG